MAAAKGSKHNNTASPRSWVDKHLETRLFDSTPTEHELQLNLSNFAEVAYASTRMLHAWDIPPWIDWQPYVDASYTCSCPASELARLGYKKIVAIATEPGALYQDLFQTVEIPPVLQDVSIYIIKPDLNLKEFGVDFTNAGKDGRSA